MKQNNIFDIDIFDIRTLKYIEINLIFAIRNILNNNINSTENSILVPIRELRGLTFLTKQQIITAITSLIEKQYIKDFTVTNKNISVIL